MIGNNDFILYNLFISLTQPGGTKVHIDWLKVGAIQKSLNGIKIFIQGDTRPFIVVEEYDKIIEIVKEKMKELHIKCDKEDK